MKTLMFILTANNKTLTNQDSLLIIVAALAHERLILRHCLCIMGNIKKKEWMDFYHYRVVQTPCKCEFCIIGPFLK